MNLTLLRGATGYFMSHKQKKQFQLIRTGTSINKNASAEKWSPGGRIGELLMTADAVALWSACSSC
jgi:hypothetical protein